MHSLCILYAFFMLLTDYYSLLFFYLFIRACFMLLFFFLISRISLCILYASIMHPLCIHYASAMPPNVHQRFSVRSLFFFVPYSFSLLYPIHTHEKLGSTQRPILGRYRPNSGSLVVSPIFFRVRIRSLSVLILFSSTLPTMHDSYIYARE